MRDWILEDKLKIEETRYTGFDKMPQAFIDLLNGKNTGKVVIQAQFQTAPNLIVISLEITMFVYLNKSSITQFDVNLTNGFDSTN